MGYPWTQKIVLCLVLNGLSSFNITGNIYIEIREETFFDSVRLRDECPAAESVPLKCSVSDRH